MNIKILFAVHRRNAGVKNLGAALDSNGQVMEGQNFLGIDFPPGKTLATVEVKCSGHQPNPTLTHYHFSNYMRVFGAYAVKRDDDSGEFVAYYDNETLSAIEGGRPPLDVSPVSDVSKVKEIVRTWGLTKEEFAKEEAERKK